MRINLSNKHTIAIYMLQTLDIHGQSYAPLRTNSGHHTSVCSSQIKLGIQESFFHQVIYTQKLILYVLYGIILFIVGVCGLLNTC